MPVYATVSDYITYTGASASIFLPSSVFSRASRVIDTALRAAVYDTDVDGLPTDDGVLAALRDATCAQARCLVEHPDEPFGMLTTEAHDVLLASGLLPAFPRMCG